MDYDLKIERAINEIKKTKAKTVCIQLPDNLKKQATEIATELEEKTKATILIWTDTCFGACDTPQIEADLLIQWGHTSFGFER